MTTKFRNIVSAAIVTAALGFSVGAAAGSVDQAAEKLRDQDQKADKKVEQKEERPPPARPGVRPQRPAPAAAPPASQREGNESRSNDNAPRNNSEAGRDRAPSRSLNDDLARLHGNDRNGNRNQGGSRGGSRNPPPPRVVQHLPPGYRDYNWNGNRYYSAGGHWYRPYGNTYISVGIPFGLFVGTLPGLYTSFWYGGTRYYYADDTYYEYEPVRGGYVVSHSPYGDDEESSDSDTSQGDDLYIYPARGQSEQQQADDRYQCHRWAAQQSHYDPLDDDYNSDLRKDYQRAMSACLTGRGYTVN